MLFKGIFLASNYSMINQNFKPNFNECWQEEKVIILIDLQYNDIHLGQWIPQYGHLSIIFFCSTLSFKFENFFFSLLSFFNVNSDLQGNDHQQIKVCRGKSFSLLFFTSKRLSKWFRCICIWRDKKKVKQESKLSLCLTTLFNHVNRIVWKFSFSHLKIFETFLPR